jgi:trehalose 6-phosphate synthase
MADTQPVGRGPGSLADTVVVSNRGPLAFHFEDGRPVAGEAAGGLAGSLQPLLQGTGATWVAATLGDADRTARDEGLITGDGMHLELLDVDPETYRLAYDVISNASLWFCHHHLFDAARRPRSDGHWSDAWDAYREYNRVFARQVAKVAPPNGRVLVHDYHLALVGPVLKADRPDLRTVHFTHTPFADPSILRMLPTSAGRELLDGMAGFDTCGFHTRRWAKGYVACQEELADRHGDDVRTFASALTADPERLAASAARPEVRAARARLDEAIGGEDRMVIARVDRMEPSKNLLRGFWAFDELLAREPALRGRTVFVAATYPSRQGLAEYIAYQNEVESTVARINERWGTPGWTPVILTVEDDRPRALAAFGRYDVLLVNPVRDGLNLVAKEGPLVNSRGVLALSREAGAFDELHPYVHPVNPFDVADTASVLARALALEPAERAAQGAALRRLILERSPGHWLDDQLAAAG